MMLVGSMEGDGGGGGATAKEGIGNVGAMAAACASRGTKLSGEMQCDDQQSGRQSLFII